jgi:transcriptional regulator with XRE-family HTH domain
MSYALEDIARTLKEARERKGLSQRALSQKAGVPQGHISNIENGAVDLRLSSLIELARVLDLELKLVPRNVLSAINAVVRSSEWESSRAPAPPRSATKELDAFAQFLTKASETRPAATEIAQLQTQLRDLQHFPLNKADLEQIRKAHALVRDQLSDPQFQDAIRTALNQLRQLRNVIAHDVAAYRGEDGASAAYSLHGEDDG